MLRDSVSAEKSSLRRIERSGRQQVDLTGEGRVGEEARRQARRRTDGAARGIRSGRTAAADLLARRRPADPSGIVTSFRTLRRAWRIRQAVSLWSSASGSLRLGVGSSVGVDVGAVVRERRRYADAGREDRRRRADSAQRDAPTSPARSHRPESSAAVRRDDSRRRCARSEIRTGRQRAELESPVLVGDRDGRRRAERRDDDAGDRHAAARPGRRRGWSPDARRRGLATGGDGRALGSARARASRCAHNQSGRRPPPTPEVWLPRAMLTTPGGAPRLSVITNRRRRNSRRGSASCSRSCR